MRGPRTNIFRGSRTALQVAGRVWGAGGGEVGGDEGEQDCGWVLSATAGPAALFITESGRRYTLSAATASERWLRRCARPVSALRCTTPPARRDPLVSKSWPRSLRPEVAACIDLADPLRPLLAFGAAGGDAR
jgi:hypothetical protein